MGGVSLCARRRFLCQREQSGRRDICDLVSRCMLQINDFAEVVQAMYV